MDDVDFGSFFSHLKSRSYIPTSTISVVYFPSLFLHISNGIRSCHVGHLVTSWLDIPLETVDCVIKAVQYAEDGISRTAPRRQDTRAEDR